MDDYCTFLYIVRNSCNIHPKMDVSCLPNLDDIGQYPKMDVSPILDDIVSCLPNLDDIG